MRIQRPIWLVSTETTTTDAVAEVVSAHGSGSRIQPCHDLGELVAHLEQNGGAIAMVDIDPDPAQALRDLEPVVGRFTQTKFVALSHSFRPELILEAMQVGARHYVAKQSIGTTLQGILDRIGGNGSAAAPPHGEAITVLSAGGGCGATTLAVNLADELRLVTGEPALVVDCDTAYGGVGTYLGLHGQYGLADVLSRTDRVDPQLIRSTAMPFTEDLHALLSPATVNFADAPAINWDKIDPALDSCRRVYRWVVLDAARVPVPVAARMAHASRVSLIVCQFSVKDLRTARSLRAALIERGISAERIRCVANRYQKKHALIGLEEARKVLGEVELELLSNDFRSAWASANLGKPLAEAAPRSELRREIRRIAETLGEPVAVA